MNIHIHEAGKESKHDKCGYSSLYGVTGWWVFSRLVDLLTAGLHASPLYRVKLMVLSNHNYSLADSALFMLRAVHSKNYLGGVDVVAFQL